jgi:hypothetical protein
MLRTDRNQDDGVAGCATRFEQLANKLADKFAAAARDGEASRQYARDHITAVTAAPVVRPEHTRLCDSDVSETQDTVMAHGTSEMPTRGNDEHRSVL